VEFAISCTLLTKSRQLKKGRFAMKKMMVLASLAGAGLGLATKLARPKPALADWK